MHCAAAVHALLSSLPHSRVGVQLALASQLSQTTVMHAKYFRATEYTMHMYAMQGLCSCI